MTLKFDRWHWRTIGNIFLLCYVQLCASFQSHWWIQTGVTVRKHKVGQNWRFFVPCDLGIGRMTLKNNRATLLCHLKFCASFHHHMWIGYWPLWPWPLTSTFCMDITSVSGNVVTPENFMMTRWWEHSKKRCDRRTDGRTEPFIELLGRS